MQEWVFKLKRTAVCPICLIGVNTAVVRSLNLAEEENKSILWSAQQCSRLDRGDDRQEAHRVRRSKSLIGTSEKSYLDIRPTRLRTNIRALLKLHVYICNIQNTYLPM